MICPKCYGKKLIKQTTEVTTKVKFRVVTHLREKTMCEDCKEEFYTPDQLDNNSAY